MGVFNCYERGKTPLLLINFHNILASSILCFHLPLKMINNIIFMENYFKIRCLAFYLLLQLFLFESKAQNAVADNTTLFSSYLKDNNAGFKYKIISKKDPDSYESNLNKDIFRLAYLTGFIIFIDKPKTNKEVQPFNRLLVALKKAHYHVYTVNNKPFLCYAIPSIFVNQFRDIVFYLDGDYTVS